MKKFIFSFLFGLTCFQSIAQITITPGQTALQLANLIVATSGTLGVVISNPVLTCDSLANGELLGVSDIGISNGVVLSTGYVNSDSVNAIVGLNGLPGEFSTAMIGSPGDSMLNTIITPYVTYDACVLEFDLQPVGNFVEFEYVFGSEEYPEFNCSAFNDVFGFYISGPGFANPTNIALIPATALPVSINSINDGTGGACSAYQNLYVNNVDTFNTMDGFTTPLIAHAAVTPGQNYHLKLAIADVSDGILNSFVILKANSLKSGNTTPSGISNFSAETGLEVYPTEIDHTLSIHNSLMRDWKMEIVGMDGKVVYHNTMSKLQNRNSYEVGQLAPGIYLLKMTRMEDGKVFTEKVLVR